MGNILIGNILTATAQSYISNFSGFVHQFLAWGENLFYVLLTLNLTWMFLWYAFDNKSLIENMSSFIRQFFITGFFYTLMVNPSLFTDLLKSTYSMGQSLNHLPMDPSSLISEGIAIANKVLIHVTGSSLLTAGFGLLLSLIVYIIIIFVFLSVALDVALTLIITTALITVSSFFLGFAALSATSQIARKTLDMILSNCVKLLGIYMVIAAGHHSIAKIADSIPIFFVSFDSYVWIVASVVLFWLIAKNLPSQLARLVSEFFRENEGTSAAALASSPIQYAKAAGIATVVAREIAKVVGSTAYNAKSHFGRASDSKGIFKSSAAALGGSMAHLAKSVGGHVADHFKHVANKLAGGPGLQESKQSVSQRMYSAAKNVQQDRANRQKGRESKDKSS